MLKTNALFLITCCLITFTACDSFQESSSVQDEIEKARQQFQQIEKEDVQKNNQLNQELETLKVSRNQDQYLEINPYWNLVQGTPPYADPSPIIYEGEVELKASLIYQSSYVGDSVAHLKISQDDLMKIPEFLRERNFRIDVSEGLSEDEIL